jgi:hypothetical protein
LDIVTAEVAYVVRYRAGRAAWLRDLLYAVAGQVQPVAANILVDGDDVAGQDEAKEVVQRMGELVEAGIVGGSSLMEALASVRAPYCSVMEDVDIPYPRQAAVLSAALRAHPAAGGARGLGYLVRGQIRDGVYVAMDKQRWDISRSDGTLVLGAFMFRTEVLHEAARSGSLESPGDTWEAVLGRLASAPAVATVDARVAERRVPSAKEAIGT